MFFKSQIGKGSDPSSRALFICNLAAFASLRRAFAAIFAIIFDVVASGGAAMIKEGVLIHQNLMSDRAENSSLELTFIFLLDDIYFLLVICFIVGRENRKE